MSSPTPEVHVSDRPEGAALALAEFIAAESRLHTEADGRFTIALSGGSTPARMLALLAGRPFSNDVPWGRWHVFWGDERCVPPEHPDSNYRMARETLLDHVPIPGEQVHRMRGETGPQDAADEYEATLRLSFPQSPPEFDLILLGLGEDGHTASLFPGTDALQERERLVVANWAPHLQAYRLTFTLPLLNAARRVAFLATGGSKAEVVRRALQTTTPGADIPAARVRPGSGAIHWFLDRAAAALL